MNSARRRDDIGQSFPMSLDLTDEQRTLRSELVAWDAPRIGLVSEVVPNEQLAERGRKRIYLQIRNPIGVVQDNLWANMGNAKRYRLR